MNVLEKVSVTKTALGIARPPQSKVFLGKVTLKNVMHGKRSRKNL